jgi:hypothetical protein
MITPRITPQWLLAVTPDACQQRCKRIPVLFPTAVPTTGLHAFSDAVITINLSSSEMGKWNSIRRRLPLQTIQKGEEHGNHIADCFIADPVWRHSHLAV